MREWWLRTLLVLQAPRPVFTALRNDSEESAADRAEPVLAVILLAGMAIALASNAATSYRGLMLPVLIFIGGGITGAAAYFIFGGLLYYSARLLGSHGSFRRARHVLAFASVPIALSLIASPAGRHAFAWIIFVFVAWSTVLLVIGVRAVHGWSWLRAAGAVAPIALIVAVLLAR